MVSQAPRKRRRTLLTSMGAMTLLDLGSMPRFILVNWLAGSYLMPGVLRFLIYLTSGMKLRTAFFMPGCVFRGSRVRVGRGTRVSLRCYFDANGAPIEIGEDCGIGPEVMFLTGDHDIATAAERLGPVRFEAVRVGNGVWIGARATILSGVTVGDGCVIAAGAVVTKSCEPNGLYAGVPARRIRDL